MSSSFPLARVFSVSSSSSHGPTFSRARSSFNGFTRFLLFLAVLFGALASTPLDTGVSLASENNNYAVKGRASWYGTTAHGRQTANGEIYNRYALTAAHKGLPFGTLVRVHNLRNGRSVIVRINDRGPFIQGRIVDVSTKAAEILGMVDSGVVPVKLEVIRHGKTGPRKEDHAFYVHLADEKTAIPARIRAGALERRYGDQISVLYLPEGTGKGYSLCLGPYDTFAEAHAVFMRQRGAEVAKGQGIIEAPTTGRVPFYYPQQTEQMAEGPKRLEGVGEIGEAWRVGMASWHPTLYAISTRVLERKGLVVANL